MDHHIGYIMTVSNSIIGVSILAMPYCFKQCGIILSIVMLLASGMISRLTCHYLLKSATMARRRTFELLSFHIFGTMGKLVVELGIIGFLMGTCVAFFVIIGDLGPAILAKVLDIENNYSLRTSMLICVALFCIVPLGLLKNVESLGSVSTATIGFYFCLVLKTIAESATHFAKDDWMSKVELWKPHGVLQCLPIFAMALSCQTQLFEIYETLPNASLEKMNYVVRSAVNICTCVYICVGFFGYVAFVNYPFTGNILMSFSPSIMTDAMKIGFVLSVACSFPLVIFPCRASLYSLLFRKGYAPYEGVNNFIPETRFKLLTVFIVGASLSVGIIIPNIEVVLGLLGSTIGTMICVIFPVTCFICISTKNTNERILAQIMLFVGVIMMVMGTYANLYAMEEISTTPMHLERIQLLPINPVVEVQPLIDDARDKYMIDIKKGKIVKNPDVLKMPVAIVTSVPIIKNIQETIQEVRREPPQPVEPYDEEQFEKDIKAPKLEEKLPNKEVFLPENVEKIKIPVESKTIKTVEVDKAAIEKEDNELKEQEKINKSNEDKKADDVIATLEKHKEEQKVLIQQQQKLLEEIKKETKELQDKHLEDIEKDKEIRAKAANQIVEIAKKALEILDPKNENIKNAEQIIEKLSQNNTQGKNPSKENIVDENKIKFATENTSIAKDSNLNTQKKMIPLPILVNIRENPPKEPTVDLMKTISDPKNIKKMDEVKNYNLKNDNEVVKEIPLIGKESGVEKIKTEKPESKIIVEKIQPTEKVEIKVGRDILANSESKTEKAIPNIVGEMLNKSAVMGKIDRKEDEPKTEKTSSNVSEIINKSEVNKQLEKKDVKAKIPNIITDILNKNPVTEKIDLKIGRDILHINEVKTEKSFTNGIEDSKIVSEKSHDTILEAVKISDLERKKRDIKSEELKEDCEITTKSTLNVKSILSNVDILNNNKDILNSIKFTDTLLKNYENFRRK